MEYLYIIRSFKELLFPTSTAPLQTFICPLNNSLCSFISQKKGRKKEKEHKFRARPQAVAAAPLRAEQLLRCCMNINICKLRLVQQKQQQQQT